MALRAAWKPIFSSNWGVSYVILAALSFYGDGERNGDGDSVVELVKCYERESSNRYILTVTANDDVGTSLNGRELIAMSGGGCLQFWVACRREKKLQIMHAIVSSNIGLCIFVRHKSRPQGPTSISRYRVAVKWHKYRTLPGVRVHTVLSLNLISTLWQTTEPSVVQWNVSSAVVIFYHAHRSVPCFKGPCLK